MVTIKDVAREAGVSVATVSRVFNNSALVKEPTRLEVQRVAARLGYSPHVAARSLITSKTSTIGVLLPDLYGEFFSEVIRGIDQAVQREGYHLLVSSSHDDESEIEAALRSMHGRVDGLIVMSPDMDARAAVQRLAERFPVVLLNCAVEGDALDAITIDNYGGAYAIVRHLIALGHRRIAIITGGARNFDALERRRGYRAALAEAGIARNPAWEVPGDFSDTSGYHAVQRLLVTTPRPTAIFATNDAMAIGALSALREAGISVPDGVAVAGFDDIPMARYMNPPLTTVHVDITALGERSILRLLEVLRGEGDATPARRETLPTHLVIRASCGG
jgi:LacI family transcriptional regulator